MNSLIEAEPFNSLQVPENESPLKDLLFFFKVNRPGDITWAHRVNQTQRLKEFWQTAMMIEGDVWLRNGVPVMVHDQGEESDLSFKVWIKTIVNSGKGAKLDFKNPLAVTPCLKQLQNIDPKSPIILNADILQGPGGNVSEFEPDKFINLCRGLYPKGVLSLGWITELLQDGEYTADMVAEMLAIAERIGNIPVTFCVRACYLESSYSELLPLTEKPNHMITIWNNEPVPDDLKEWMNDNLNPDKTFYDLMDTNGDPLRL